MKISVCARQRKELAIVFLFCAFCVFNLHYPPNCTTFYELLEVFLNKPVPARKPQLSSVMAELRQLKA